MSSSKKVSSVALKPRSKDAAIDHLQPQIQIEKRKKNYSIFCLQVKQRFHCQVKTRAEQLKSSGSTRLERLLFGSLSLLALWWPSAERQPVSVCLCVDINLFRLPVNRDALYSRWFEHESVSRVESTPLGWMPGSLWYPR